MDEKMYRTAYVAGNSGHDFQPLLKLCKDLKFCVTGYEREEDIPGVLKESLKDFDPRLDVLVPVGNVTTNMLVGIVLARMWPSGDLNMAFYHEREYHVSKMGTGGTDGQE